MKDTDITMMIIMIIVNFAPTGVTGMHDGKVENLVRLLTVTMSGTGRMMTKTSI